MRQRTNIHATIATALLVSALLLGVCLFAFAAPDESLGAEHGPVIRSSAALADDLTPGMPLTTLAIAAIGDTSVVQGRLQIAATTPDLVPAPYRAPLQSRAPPAASRRSP